MSEPDDPGHEREAALDDALVRALCEPPPSPERLASIRRRAHRVLIVGPPSRFAEAEWAVAGLFSVLMLGWAIGAVVVHA